MQNNKMSLLEIEKINNEKNLKQLENEIKNLNLIIEASQD
jgi:hypothetical protein